MLRILRCKVPCLKRYYVMLDYEVLHLHVFTYIRLHSILLRSNYSALYYLLYAFYYILLYYMKSYASVLNIKFYYILL